jgi:hypothetical protein
MIKKAELVTKLERANGPSDGVFIKNSEIKMKKSADLESKELFTSKENVNEKSKKSETKLQKDSRSESKKDLKINVDAKNVKGQKSNSDTKSPKRSEVKVKDVDAKKRGQAMRRLRGSVHTIQALSMLSSRCSFSNTLKKN